MNHRFTGVDFLPTFASILPKFLYLSFRRTCTPIIFPRDAAKERGRKKGREKDREKEENLNYAASTAVINSFLGRNFPDYTGGLPAVSAAGQTFRLQ